MMVLFFLFYCSQFFIVFNYKLDFIIEMYVWEKQYVWGLVFQVFSWVGGGVWKILVVEEGIYVLLNLYYYI